MKRCLFILVFAIIPYSLILSQNLEEQPKFFATLDDIIVNPAGSSGQRLLLVSIGFGFQSEKEKKELEEKKVVFLDIIINTLSSKTYEQLIQAGYKDTLKKELSINFIKANPDFKFISLYFGKYILQ